MSSSYLLFILACLRHYTLFQVGEEELFLGKTWKLNAERNNGRGAMMGITGALQQSRAIVSRAIVSRAITVATLLRGLELVAPHPTPPEQPCAFPFRCSAVLPCVLTHL